jgi:hypothetical protein
MDKQSQLIFHRKLPYGYCWWCSKKLMRVTRGKRSGQYAYSIVEVHGIDRVVHKECVRRMEKFQFDHPELSIGGRIE